jgi:hypothetical protein
MTKKKNCENSDSDENEPLIDIEVDDHIYVPPIFVDKQQNSNEFSINMLYMNQQDQIYPPIYVDNVNQQEISPSHQQIHKDNDQAIQKKSYEHNHQNTDQDFHQQNNFYCDSNNCESSCKDDNNFVFGLLNVKKMEIIPGCPCEFVLQINYIDFLCPLSIVDQNDKTNQDIPFLISLDSWIFQLQKRKNITLIIQCYIENCCFHFIFKVKEVCYIPGYQLIIFTKIISGHKDSPLVKILKCHHKIMAYNAQISYYIPQGRISFPKIKCEHSQKKHKKR